MTLVFNPHFLFIIIISFHVVTNSWPTTFYSYFTLNSENKQLQSCINDLTSNEYFCMVYNKETSLYELYLRYQNSQTLSVEIQQNNFTSLDYFFKQENTYYLFSENSKSFFKVTISNGNSLVITEDASQGTAFPSDYFIQPFYIKDSNLFVALLHKSESLFVYELNTNSWITGPSVGGIIHAGMISNKYVKPTHIYSLTTLNSQYFICRVIYDGGFNWSPRFQINPSASLYSKHSIGIKLKNMENENTYLFTYEPNNYFYKFYHINIKTQKISYFGETDQLHNIFNPSIHIIKANFYDNSQYLYYLTKSINSSFMQIGVIDVEYSIQIYHINIDISSYNSETISDIGIFNNTQSSSDVNHVFLYVLIGDTQYTLCPFVYNANSHQCSTADTNNRYMNISESNGNAFVSECQNGYVLGIYCLESCPIGFPANEITKTCDICNEYYLVNKRTCNSTCPSNIFDLNKYCNDCNEDNLIFYKNTCVETCESIYGEYIEESNSCYNCKENKKYFYNNQCVDSCPKGSEINIDTFECIFCKEHSKYYSHGKCVDSCEINELYYEESYICYTCFENDENLPYKQGNTCVDKCSEGFATNQSLFMCEYCKDLDLYYYKDECISECPMGFISIENNICFSCRENYPDTPYIQDETCVANCSKGYEINEEYKMCLSCKSLGKYLNHSLKCASSCEEFSLYDEDNICYFCNETSLKYYQDETCVSACSLGYEINEEYTICRNCKKENFFYIYSQKKCMNESSCEEYSIKDIDTFTCYLCKDMYPNEPWIFDNHCVEECPDSSVQINTNNYCRYCKSEGLYVENKKCVDKCSQYRLVNETDHRCLRCVDSAEFGGIYFDVEENKCVSECKEGYITSLNEFACISCKKQNEFYQEDKCNPLCKENTYADNETHICYECYCTDRGTCNHNTSQCKCENNSIGYNCEMIKTNITYENNNITIISLNSNNQIRKSLVNCFGFKLDNEIDVPHNEYKINWNLNILKSPFRKENYFYNGYNEDIFCIPPNTFALGKESNVLTIKYNDITNNKIYNDSLNVTVESFLDEYYDSKRFLIEIRFQNKEKYIPMETIISLNITDVEKYKNKLLIILSIIDKYGEELPLTSVNSNKMYLLTLPHATTIKVTILNDRKEIIEKNYTKNEGIVEDPQNYTSNILEDIIHAKPYISNTTKLFLLQKYFFYSNNTMKENEVKETISFIQDRFNDILSNDNISYTENISQYNTYDNNSYHFDYFEQRTLYAVINYMAMFSYKENEVSFLNDVTDLLMYISRSLNEKINLTIVPETYLTNTFSNQMKSLFRTIDTIMGQSLHIINNEYVNINKKLKYIVNNYTQFLSRHTSKNQDMQLVGKYIVIQINRFGREQTLLHVNKTDFQGKDEMLKFGDYIYNDRSISLKSTEEKSKKPINYFIKIQKEHYLKIADDIIKDSDNNENIKNYSFNVIQIPQKKIKTNLSLNNDNDNNYYYISLISLYNPSKNTIYTNTSELIIEASFPHDKTISRLNTADISCIPDNTYEITNEKWCKTHFNYDKNHVVCTCQHSELISYINDTEYSSKSKQFQFSTITNNKQTNSFSILIIYISFIIIIIPTFCYLIRDCLHNLKSNKKPKIHPKHHFNNMRCLFNASAIKLAWYFTLVKIPFIDYFKIEREKHNNIQFAKYYIRTTLMFFTLILSTIPYFTFIKNTEREIFINERDFFKNDEMINNLSLTFGHLVRGFGFAIGASIITKLILFIIEIVICETEEKNKCWKPIEKSFKEYIKGDIKKEVLLGNNWTKIRKRFIAFNKLCGQHLFHKRLYTKYKTTLDKYLDYKYPQQKLIDSYEQMKLFPNELSNDIEGSESRHDGPINQMLIPHESVNNKFSINDSYEGEIQTNIISLNVKRHQSGLLHEHSVGEERQDDKNKGNMYQQKDLFVRKEISFTLNKNIKKQIHYKKLQKIESIRNKYMHVYANGTIINSLLSESELDSNSHSKLSASFSKNIEITYQENFTYLSKTIYPSTSPLYLSPELQKHKTIIYRLYIILGILLLLLIATYIFIIVKFSSLYNSYRKLIIKCWLIPSLIQILVINFIYLFLWNFIISYALFNWRSLRTINYFVRLFFYLFIDKYQIYLFKIRNYITKYHNQLNYIDQAI